MENLYIVSILTMSGLGLVFAGVLAFADKKLRVVEDPRVNVINNLLPGINCGACGFLSCHDFAEHIVRDGADPAKCRVAGEDNREKLFQLTGGGGQIFPFLPLVHCSAECDNKKPAADYSGIKTCRAAALDFGAGMECEYGCMGFGDCTKVCSFGALHMENGLPIVDTGKCTGCGKCKEACPRKVINMQEKKHGKLFYVACSSHDSALRVRKICGVGCIACRICEKLSTKGLFIVDNNLSVAEYKKQISGNLEDLEKIQTKCPTKVIKDI